MTAATCFLITGASHTGKSTLAARVASETSGFVISTDTLARHPGRPWPDPRPHVVDYFANLSADTHMTLLRHHHAAMLGTIREAIRATSKRPLIVEGSALRPGGFHDPDIQWVMFCLHAPPDLIAERIRQGSGYVAASPDRQHLIDAFIARSLADQVLLLEEASSAEVMLVDVSDPAAVEAATDRAVTILSSK